MLLDACFFGQASLGPGRWARFVRWMRYPYVVVRDLVRGEIVEHIGRREDEPPGEREHARIGARAPAARLVAHRDALDRELEPFGVAAARRFEVAARLALEEVADAPVRQKTLSQAMLRILLADTAADDGPAGPRIEMNETIGGASDG